MKAVVLENFGGPENLKWTEVPKPAPKEGEALVRIRFCALNHLDLWIREGIPSYKIKLPHIPGSDISGEIAEIGPGVSSVKVGDHVAVSPGRFCSSCDFCVSGQDSYCSQYGIIGAQGGAGGYAEYICVPEKYLLPLSPSVSFAEGAAFPLTFLTAWHMLIGLGNLRPNQIVLVMGAGSGVGSAAIQIAKWNKAFVIAASRSEEKLKKAQELKADAVIHSPPQDITRQVIKITGGKMADIVFEHVGPAVFEAAIKSLAFGGKLISCGSTSGPVVNLDMRYLFSRQLQILGAKMGNLSEMREVSKLVNLGQLRPSIDKIFPLKDAAKAHQYLAEQNHFGKVLLEVA